VSDETKSAWCDCDNPIITEFQCTCGRAVYRVGYHGPPPDPRSPINQFGVSGKFFPKAKAKVEISVCSHCGQEKALHAGFDHGTGKCLLDTRYPYLIRTDAANAARDRLCEKELAEDVSERLSPRQEMRAKVVNILAAYYHDQISIGAVEAILDAIGLKDEFEVADEIPLEPRAPATRELVLVNMHQDIMRLREALEKISCYRHHLSFCEFETTEFCTCGMKQAVDRCRAALEPPPQEEPETPDGRG
jgi:hypothetical protein